MRNLYTGVERWFELLPKYLFLEPFLEGKRVLEIDCGTGWGTSLIARNAREVVALGANEEDVTKARESEPSLRRSFQQMIPKDLPFVDGTFDVVLAFRGAEAFGGIEALVEEARRVLRPGGIFCIAAPNPGKKTLPEVLGALEPPKGSIGFYELQKKLKGRFAQVRMIAQSPFFGFSFIDYSPEDSDSFSMDSSLLKDGSEDASSFLAFCGKVRLPPVDFSLVQLPLDELYAMAPKSAPVAEAIDKASEEELLRLRVQKTSLLRAKGELEAKVEEITHRLKKIIAQPKSNPEDEQLKLAQQKQLEALAQQKTELEKALEEGKAREEKLSADRLRMERNVIEYLGKINEQRNTIKDSEERREELTAKLVRQTNQQRELQKQITEGRFSEANLQSSLERHENELKEAERKLQKIDDARKAREQELADKAQSLEKERESLTAALDDLRRAFAKKEEEAAEEAKRARQLEARARRAELDANEAKEQTVVLSKEKRQLEDRAQSAEAQWNHIRVEDDDTRGKVQGYLSLLAEKDYLLAESSAFRLDAEWRAEELSQELALRRSMRGGALLSSLEARAFAASQSAEIATEKVTAHEADLQKLREENTAAQATLQNLHQERSELSAQKQELEHALEEAERRAAAARERSLAAARDATLARSRQSKLESELAELNTAHQALLEKGAPPSAERPAAPNKLGPERSLRVVIRRQAELLRRAAVERKQLLQARSNSPREDELDERLSLRRSQLEQEAAELLESRKVMLQDALHQTITERHAQLENEAATALLARKAELEEQLQQRFALQRSELEAKVEEAFLAKQAQLDGELALALARQRAELEAEAESAFLAQKRQGPSEDELNTEVSRRLQESAHSAQLAQSKLSSELAQARAALEACRIARSEADKKTRAALERAAKAEEELASRSH